VYYKIYFLGINMTVQELIKAAKERVLTEQDILALQQRMRAAEEKYEEQQRKQRITPEFLNRTYTL
jgi:hypothetical protein